jgi:hypothetical protein
VSLYLDLLERSLLGLLTEDPPLDPWNGDVTTQDGVVTIRPGKFDGKLREEGLDWPQHALTMIGFKRLRNLRYLATQALLGGIEGDFAECGVWRGGACILLAGLLRQYGWADRRVWICDSFTGLPPPTLPEDAGDQHSTFKPLAIPLEDVATNFARYGLLSNDTQFIRGWFKDTLPGPIQKLAVLRIDADMYEGVRDALAKLYPLVSPGGSDIVDDYLALKGCALAVDEYRNEHDITAPVVGIDSCGVYWRKP